MRSRIVGGVALFFGLAIVALMLQEAKPLAWKPLLGGLAFTGLGGYYLVTGRSRGADVRHSRSLLPPFQP